MRNNSQTNREKTKTSSTTSENLSAPINNDTTTMLIIDRKISLATEGLQPYVENWLRTRTSDEIALTISEYILSLRREINPSQNYTKMQIQAIVELSEYLKQKPFEHFERHDNFIEFMKSNEFLDMDSYQTMVANIEKFQKGELKKNDNSRISLKQVCSHFADITNENISPRTVGCEECEKEGTKWVDLRLCLTCGHVGCCDSSKGMHATKHFVNTTHPLIVAMPDKPWKWCYVDKIYE